MHNLEAPIPCKKTATVVKVNSSNPKGIFEELQEVDSFNEDEMILEGIDPPVKQPGVTWYVKKHYINQSVNVDIEENELTGTNKATDEESLAPVYLQGGGKTENGS